MSWYYGFVPGSRPDGQPILSVIAKRTYALDQESCRVADEQIPLHEQDVYENPDDPGYSETLAESDFIFYKPFTDVVVTGSACAPKGKRAYHLDCGVRVGPVSKTVRVYGDRRIESRALRGAAFTDPAPFETRPIGYANAYGGIAANKQGTIYTYPPNPIGKGFAIKGGFEEVESIAVPSQEDPARPFTAEEMICAKFEEWAQAPAPASLGWTRRNFYPRYTFAGVLPEYLEAARESLREAREKNPRFSSVSLTAMDFRIYQGASDGLGSWLLEGAEAVHLRYLDRQFPDFRFALPGDPPVLTLDVGEGPRELDPVLQTVSIDMHSRMLSMVWRGSMEYDGVEAFEHMPRIVPLAVAR
jgi:hypothetical protein